MLVSSEISSTILKTGSDKQSGNDVRTAGGWGSTPSQAAAESPSD